MFKDDDTPDPHALALHVLNEYEIITFQDTEEVFYFDYDRFCWINSGEHLIKKIAQEKWRDKATKYYVNEAIEHVKRSTFKNRDEIKMLPPELIPLNNCIINIKTFEHQPFTPDYFYTSKISVDYNPDADCPEIKKFFSEVLHPDDIPVIEELFGYCLYRGYPIHKAFLFHGNTHAGKSTMIRLLTAFLGKQNVVSIPLQQLTVNRFATAKLFGKLACVYADLSQEALTETGLFKMLTGEDLVPAEIKFKSGFEFVNHAKLIFSCNEIPKTHDETDAFWNRWIIINFPNQFLENKDEKLIEKLTTPEELSGLLNLALAGLKRLLENGKFSYSKSAEEVREYYIRLSNSAQAFLDDMTEEDVKGSVLAQELYEAYVRYCSDYKLTTYTRGKFFKELQRLRKIEKFTPKVGDRRLRGYKGIRLKEAKEQTELDNQIEYDDIDFKFSSSYD